MSESHDARLIDAMESAISTAAYPDVHPDFTDAGWRRMASAAIDSYADWQRQKVGPIYGENLADLVTAHALRLSYPAHRETVDLMCQAAAEIRALTAKAA